MSDELREDAKPNFEFPMIWHGIADFDAAAGLYTEFVGAPVGFELCEVLHRELDFDAAKTNEQSNDTSRQMPTQNGVPKSTHRGVT